MTLVRFTPEVAADLAERVGEIYGLRLEVTMVIEGETDASIGMRAPDGDGYLVKARPDRMDSPDLIWQEQVHVRLAQHRFPFDVPRLIASQSGELRVELEVEGIPHIVRVLTFLEGELMSNVNVVPGADFLTDLGAVSARLTQALADLIPPPGLTEHFWVLTRSLDALTESLDRLPESHQTTLVRQIMEYVASALSGVDNLPVCTVHQDLNTHNVLVDPDNPVRVTGVIDFNDTVRTIRVADIAIAAGYAMLVSDHPLDAFATVVRGYLAIAPLTNEEKSVLFPLALIRLCVNWTTWLARSEGDPESYAASRMSATWPTIQWVVDAGFESCQRSVRERLA
jgi:Ser/Thr protein kinase RdoA (MazF antagonist)